MAQAQALTQLEGEPPNAGDDDGFLSMPLVLSLALVSAQSSARSQAEVAAALTVAVTALWLIWARGLA